MVVVCSLKVAVVVVCPLKAAVVIVLCTQVPVEVEKCQDRGECFNADLKADWERWQSNKRQDFRQLLTSMADKNINYFEKVRLGLRLGAPSKGSRSP